MAKTQKVDRRLARGWLRECGFVDSTRGVTGRSDIGRWDLQRGPARDEPAGLERCSAWLACHGFFRRADKNNVTCAVALHRLVCAKEKNAILREHVACDPEGVLAKVHQPQSYKLCHRPK